MKTFLVAFLAALSAAIGEALLSYAMKRGGPVDMAQFSHWANLVMSVVRNSYIFIGVVFLAVYFFLYLIALSWADLSFVLPLTAVSYIFAAILARIFLKEDVTWLRWMGTLVIIVGITLIALDGRQRTGSPLPGAHGKNNAFSQSSKK
jgi:drug/metabolite transporter (DMT)-like permease